MVRGNAVTYWLINAWFLGAAVLLLAVSVLVRKPPSLKGVGGSMLLVLVLTAVFDNAIIGSGIVAYDPAKISGVKVGLAPLEDFAYTVAAALVIPTLWSMLGKRSES